MHDYDHVKSKLLMNRFGFFRSTTIFQLIFIGSDFHLSKSFISEYCLKFIHWIDLRAGY